MSRQICLALLVLASACSQRSPWRVVAAPFPKSQQESSAAAPGDAPATSTAPTSKPAAPADATAVAHLRDLTFPVAGIDSTRLDDSFDEPREGGVRRHNAIDIMAPRGSAVLSVQDGRILRLTKSAKGGTTIYATDLEEQFVYYYAHLDRYHENIYVGRPLLRGDTLGFVGTTGNAPKDLPHLHFQVMRMPADRRFWIGDPLNPYPLLRPAASTSSGK